MDKFFSYNRIIETLSLPCSLMNQCTENLSLLVLPTNPVIIFKYFSAVKTEIEISDKQTFVSYPIMG